MLPLSYILPIKAPGPAHPRDGDLDRFLRTLVTLVDEVIVDGSDPIAFRANTRAWAGIDIAHVPPDPWQAPRNGVTNGKVAGVRTGLRLATHEIVVLADDDVRHTGSTLAEMVRRLDGADLVWPQNHFDPLPWHARWDTARTLLNSALHHDYPGTVGLRRGALEALRGYDGDVLFENLELLRTMQVGGARVAICPDVHVARRPPSTAHFASQRLRQAYDSLATPGRFILELTVLPLVLVAALQRDHRKLVGAAALTVAVAELGRRRAHGRDVFPPTSALWAPVWVLERAICAWIALAARVLLGGIRYGDVRLVRAATPRGVLRPRLAT